jgi:dihydropteroate synthase
MLAMLSGARIVRAHDVAPTVDVIRVFCAMGNRYGGS